MESTNEFVETKDILSRHDTLLATNRDLMERLRYEQECIENARKSSMETTQVLNFKIQPNL